MKYKMIACLQFISWPEHVIKHWAIRGCNLSSQGECDVHSGYALARGGAAEKRRAKSLSTIRYCLRSRCLRVKRLSAAEQVISKLLASALATDQWGLADLGLDRIKGRAFFAFLSLLAVASAFVRLKAWLTSKTKSSIYTTHGLTLTLAPDGLYWPCLFAPFYLTIWSKKAKVNLQKAQSRVALQVQAWINILLINVCVKWLVNCFINWWRHWINVIKGTKYDRCRRWPNSS